MRALVIGYGSIGSRHARILKELGCEVGVLSQRRIEFPRSYDSLKKALTDLAPEYVVIASCTSDHFPILCALKKARFKGVVMVEKPLFKSVERMDPRFFKKIFVGYNLRFHPLIQRLQKILKGKKIITAQAYVGKDLRTWRPGIDYKKSYSARSDRGGGALRDLSHELDYMNWFLGGWISVTAVGGHYSKLKIATDDAFCVLMKTKQCENVFVQMNYIDHAGHRTVIVNTEDLTIQADLLNEWIEVNGKREEYPVERDYTYREEHKAVLERRWHSLCSYQEGMDVMRLIMAAEKAAKAEKWVKR